MIVHSLNEVFH